MHFELDPRSATRPGRKCYGAHVLPLNQAKVRNDYPSLVKADARYSSKRLHRSEACEHCEHPEQNGEHYRDRADGPTSEAHPTCASCQANEEDDEKDR